MDVDLQRSIDNFPYGHFVRRRRRKDFVFLMNAHPLFNDGLEKLLNELFIVKSFSKIEDVNEICFQNFKSLNNQIAIIDICNLGSSNLQFLINLRKSDPKLKLIILSDYITPEFVHSCFIFGATGVIAKNSPIQMIKKAIIEMERVDKSRRYIHKQTKKSKRFYSINDPANMIELSKREHDVLEALLKGLNNSEIANQLEITESTIKSHMSSIIQKFNARSRTEIVIRYIEFNKTLKAS